MQLPTAEIAHILSTGSNDIRFAMDRVNRAINTAVEQGFFRTSIRLHESVTSMVAVKLREAGYMAYVNPDSFGSPVDLLVIDWATGGRGDVK